MVENRDAVDVGTKGAAARTAAEGSARLSYGLQVGAPEADAWDRTGDGVVDFATRRAQVSEVLLPAHVRTKHPRVPEVLATPRDVLYDGANHLVRSGDVWFAFTDGDRNGPRSPQDPLWLLDALFGATGEVVEAGPESLRGVTTRHYRLTVDLAAADDLLPAGIELPEGPLRRLRRMLTEVWLDDAGRARQIAIRNAAGDRQVWKVVEFWDFGIPVMITMPEDGRIRTPGPADWQRIMVGDGQQDSHR